MTHRELLERALTDHKRMKRQIEIQAWFEYALLAVLAAFSFFLLFRFEFHSKSLWDLFGSFGFIAAMWVNMHLAKGRWQALSDWIDREHAETLRLVRSAES